MNTFLLPDLGEGLTEAEIVRWLVAEGDVIEIDQPVVEVETAKAMVEVPSPHAGRVATRHAAEGATVDVGAPLITVTAVGAAAGAAAGAAVGSAEVYREEERAGSGNVLIGYGTTPGAGAVRHRRPRGRETVPASPAVAASPVATGPVVVARVVSPLVRRLAREGGVDLAALEGTGPGGVITRRDVESVVSVAPVIPAPRVVSAIEQATFPKYPMQDRSAGSGGSAGERRVPLSGFRKAAAAVLGRSRAEIPEATVWVDVDATPLWELRERTRGVAGSPGLMAYVARFVVAGLRVYPVLNSRLDVERQEIVELDGINLGIAVQSDRGLVVPAVMGAQAMTTTELDAAIRDVTARARRNESTPAGTFTLNNYGAFRVDGSAPIINHPQVAMLGLGRVMDRPWVVDGALCVRKIVQLSFVFDHRVCDGATAAGFMRVVADAMEDPAGALARM
ncbi:pyruvate dehydrogenase E2 component (dihydrolipoamide acetyltransferase) [Actinoplanes lutulentus]|uniref:Dihydrolipoamide acetyltransferase component of pyruvate dehydrogenase complex n=1 Tax=Actinoplanes lutulentus TaxID=1287878 RepID=A0A327Z9L0_9ACTN|nr:dihydrolipoamide acetyltransferase family protein [Actinoplanes lutulentus]MBB2946720.1 pyruvate dehydrogenase E2 component (dihydrolipoamide acetyltransferase) [Actinoplanes lutulentus]RAK35612.1 pyruvate dehydrogenase E2 component (dihydrolipoamide acetyltransferase) [Actinoplanes lutulentus]